MLGQSRGGDSNFFLSKSSVGGVFTSISALEGTAARVFYFRAVVTSSTGMKAEASPTKLLDKKIWNPRPEIYKAPRAVMIVTNRVPSAFF